VYIIRNLLNKNIMAREKETPTVVFVDTTWHLRGYIEDLNPGYYSFLSKDGRIYIGVYTKPWAPNWLKDSPKNKKCYDKYLLKDVTHLSLWEQKILADKIIREGYLPKAQQEQPM
jgi:hypothetical protein